jgi:TrmH family RNA methyltransferase
VPPEITSTSNERIKWLIRLRDRRHRDAEDVFVIEGRRLFDRALAAGLEPMATFATEEEALDGAVTVAPEVLDRASYRQRSEGIIGVFRQFSVELDRLALSPGGLVLVAEGIEKPGNLGAMLRTAGAAGADAVVAVGERVDPFNPNVLRSSTGAVFSMPLAVADWDTAEPWLGEHQLSIVAASPDASVSLWDADLSGPVAVVIGSEDRGLSDRALAMAAATVAIPHALGATDSLNASVAAGIVLFEAVRQRGGGVGDGPGRGEGRL